MCMAKPPIRKLLTIAAFLDAESTHIDTLITEAERAVTFSQERRTALMTAAVTGQIDVREVGA